MTEFWYEVWADESTVIPYLLILIGDPEGKFFIHDRVKGKDPIRTSDSYDEAVIWLVEDGYARIAPKRSVSRL